LQQHFSLSLHSTPSLRSAQGEGDGICVGGCDGTFLEMLSSTKGVSDTSLAVGKMKDDTRCKAATTNKQR
jgi:hypothetical protein